MKKEDLYKSWQKINLRKGTKRICKQMFINKYHDEYTFVEMKNMKIVKKLKIESTLAKEIIEFENLKESKSSTFKYASTFRKEEDNILINDLLSSL